jgi:thiol-disulfide isomerase/thioredoxin
MPRLPFIVPVLCALFLSIDSFAQLPDGAAAPDWTATDINGIEHNLYSYLDSGYAVILDFSATWCGPCWTYHNSGVLEELYESHGPNGTNEVRVFFIEADNGTTDEDLLGTGTNTWGDWTEGVNYPIIDNGGDIFSNYENTYYPTLYTVCPSGLLNQIGQASYDVHVNYVESLDCAAASLPSDPSIISYTGAIRSCPGEDVPLSIRVMNNGLEPLTSCTFEATTLFGTELLTYEWSGNLRTYEIEEIQLGNASFLTTSIFFVDIVSQDDNAANNSVSSTMNLSSQTATSLVRVRVTTDDNPQDNRWAITDITGDEVVGTSFGDLTEPNTEYIWWESMPSEGCYSFDLFDLSGNGGDIACDLSTFNDDLQNINTIFTASNSGAWSNLNKGFLVNAINTGVAEFNGSSEPILLHPNPARSSVVLNAIHPLCHLIQVHHMSGALVKEWINPNILSSGAFTLDIRGLASGVYILSGHSIASTQTAKLIIR